MVRKIGVLLLIAFLIFYVVNSPTDAAAAVKGIQHLLGRGFTSISEFVRSLQS